MQKRYFFIISAILLLCLNSHAEMGVIPKNQVREYVLNLFETQEMRHAAAQPGSSVYQLLESLSQRPLFVDYPDPKDFLHRDNFTAYAGVLNVRSSKSKFPIINDLYFLHELSHINEMPYKPGISQDEWREKMTEHEKDISLYTEFTIHFEFPELRALMPFERIYADKFLKDPKFMEFYKRDPQAALKSIRAEKHEIQTTRPVIGLTDMEFRSWYYGRTMELWADIFGPRRHEIENHMLRYYQRVKKDPAKAILQHMAWLKKNTQQDVLFRAEIAEYAKRAHSMFVEAGGLVNPFTQREFDQLNRSYERDFQDQIDKKYVEMTALVPVAQKLLSLGVATTVYSYSFPESEAVFYDVVSKFDYKDTHGRAYTRKQDIAHQEFISAYKDWAQPVVEGLADYKHAYPSNGSSEALKDSISLFKSENPEARLHVFHGEYEGAIAYAEGLKIPVVKHERTISGIRKLIATTKPGDLFYVSQPSGIDGEVWKDYNAFLRAAEKAQLKVMVDLAYVGLVPHEYKIDVSSPSIAVVFFSLSKSFGVYYHRIGGAFFRSSNSLMFGNKWFKNLLSLKFGTALLKKFNIYDLARRYRWTQVAALNEFNHKTGLNLQPADVILLATRPIAKTELSNLGNSDFASIYRGGPRHGFLRINLTPSIDTFANMNTNFNSCKLYFRY